MPRKIRWYTPAELTVWIGELKRKNDLHSFYICHAWIRLREQVLKEQHGECQLCKQRGVYTEATVVHHIKTVRSRPDLALTKSNLMALCDDCHYKIHHPGKKATWDDEKW